jgi:hypothetical protein
MSKCFSELDKSDDKAIMQFVKEQISIWANSIKHHQFKNLGGLVEIVEMVERPTYILGLHSQYDTRSVNSAETPFNGQEIPVKMYHSISEVEPWDLELDLPAEFSTAENNYIVSGSQEVISCERCKGQGRTICDTCKGQGHHKCTQCEGSCKTSCEKCNGSGKEQEKCGTCGGSTTVKSDYNDAEGRWNRINCGSCSGGYKTINCRTCHGSRVVSCWVCKGCGTVKCKPCSGSGEIDCPRCETHGKLMTYYCVNQELKHSGRNLAVKNETIEKRYPGFAIDADNSNGKFVAEYELENDSSELLNANPHLQNQLDEQVAELEQSTESNTRIVRQSLNLRRIEVLEVKYSFEEKGYRLLIFNRGEGLAKNNEYHATNSPIAGVERQYYKEGRKQFQEKNYCASYKLANKALSMNRNNDKARILLGEAEDKLKKSAYIGTWLAFFPMCLVYWIATTTYLNQAEFFFAFANNWYVENPWMADIHPLITAVLTVAFLLLIMIIVNVEIGIPLYGARVKSSFVRGILSFCTMFIFSGIIWVLLMAVDKTGINLIFAFIVHFVQGLLG